MVEEGGFEPPKRNATDLQSAPFGHSGTPPYSVGAPGKTGGFAGERTNDVANETRRIRRGERCEVREDAGAGGRIRTPDLLITNQLLYRLSYTSTWRLSNSERYYNKGKKGCQVKKQKLFIPPLRDIQVERPAWICVRCGGEQYHFDRGEMRHGRYLCARCLEDLQAEEETQ